MRAYPNENVEYTFIFPNRKEYTLVFFKEDANGRLIFFNKTTDTMTSMPKDRFSYLGRFNLVSRVKVPPKEEPKVQEVPPEWIEDDGVSDAEAQEFKKVMIRKLEIIGTSEALDLAKIFKDNRLTDQEFGKAVIKYDTLTKGIKYAN